MTIITSAALLIAFSIVVRKLNHDEGQYVAAIEFAHSGWPYRDFAYLQTPLQPILFSPMGGLPAGWLLVAARIGNGLLGLVTVAVVMLALSGRASVRSTIIALVALTCSEPFLLACSVARNDALPMALQAAAILALLRGFDKHLPAKYFATAGFLLGFASSAKINAAIPTAAAALFLVIRLRRFGGVPVTAFVLGAFVGLVPTLVLAAIAPDSFYFDVFAYSLDAPRQWWTAVGHANWLNPEFRIGRLIILAAQGCIPVGVAAAAIDCRRSDECILLDLMIVGGMITAYMPEPAFAQYLVPLLPPVAVRLALAIDNLTIGPSHRMILWVGAFSAAGLVLTVHYSLRTFGQGDDLAHAVEQAREVALAAGGRSIVTLSPERIAGSDTKLERGFVTGPFLFRTSGLLSNDAMRLAYSPNWQRIDATLDANQPFAIMTGGEATPQRNLFPRGLDWPLIEWAASHDYRPVQLSGDAVLWVHPSK